MSAALHAMMGRADALAGQWEANFKRLNSPQSIADDLPQVVGEIADILAEPLANDDAEAVGVMVLAAWRAYALRITTAVVYGRDAIAGMPDADEGACDALGKLVLRRYRGTDGTQEVTQ